MLKKDLGDQSMNSNKAVCISLFGACLLIGLICVLDWHRETHKSQQSMSMSVIGMNHVEER